MSLAQLRHPSSPSYEGDKTFHEAPRSIYFCLRIPVTRNIYNLCIFAIIILFILTPCFQKKVLEISIFSTAERNLTKLRERIVDICSSFQYTFWKNNYEYSALCGVPKIGGHFEDVVWNTKNIFGTPKSIYFCLRISMTRNIYNLYMVVIIILFILTPCFQKKVISKSVCPENPQYWCNLNKTLWDCQWWIKTKEIYFLDCGNWKPSAEHLAEVELIPTLNIWIYLAK